MSVPKLQWDGKVNIATLAMILAGILAVGAQQAQQVNTADIVRDHEVRLRTVEGFSTELASMRSQITYTAQAVERIDRRMEERDRR